MKRKSPCRISSRRHPAYIVPSIMGNTAYRKQLRKTKLATPAPSQAPTIKEEAGRWLLKSGSQFELIGNTSIFPAYIAQHIINVSDDAPLS